MDLEAVSVPPRAIPTNPLGQRKVCRLIPTSSQTARLHVLDALFVGDGLRTMLPNQRVRWDDVERIGRRAPAGLPPVVLLR